MSTRSILRLGARGEGKHLRGDVMPRGCPFSRVPKPIHSRRRGASYTFSGSSGMCWRPCLRAVRLPSSNAFRSLLLAPQLDRLHRSPRSLGREVVVLPLFQHPTPSTSPRHSKPIFAFRACPGYDLPHPPVACMHVVSDPVTAVGWSRYLAAQKLLGVRCCCILPATRLSQTPSMPGCPTLLKGHSLKAWRRVPPLATVQPFTIVHPPLVH